MSETPLFRVAAAQAQRPQTFGRIVLTRPLSYRLLTGLAVACAVSVAVFLYVGTYTQRSTVSGQLVPDAGLVKITSPQAGVVVEKRVKEGQAVQRNEVLFVLSSERESSVLGSVQAAISAQVSVRRESLEKQLGQTQLMLDQERQALQKRLESVGAEIKLQETQREHQRQRVALASQAASNYQSLLAREYIAREQADQKQTELLDQRSRLQAVERELLGLKREQATLRNELTTLDYKGSNQLAELKRGLSSTGQELAESEGRRRLSITAPVDGIATAVLAEVGQAIDGNSPLLLSIVPANAKMVAELYVPSRAVGFVKAGDPVLLRYQAYPYQKFGHAHGRVLTVPKTASLSREIPALADGHTAGGGPIYRVTVALDAQSISAYGKPQALQAGMLLEADVLQDTRRLYEWVLEPLYSITGKL
ncbi:MAG: HlyD family efflux transporter periplasmic adaptor subunit [Burkholderiaceae bacterium]|nr:HlyD family efflux transporter periplasmic adaptor subunit [Burkholderiaceae bacterium]